MPAEWGEIALTRYLNDVLGTNLAPWELDGVPDLFLELIVVGARVEASVGKLGRGD
jgi:hypothetical protein